MELLFSLAFDPTQSNSEIADIQAKLGEIDLIVQKAAPEWPLAKIARIDLSILRLAVFELMFEREIPYKVVIDEAVELAKAYGNDNSQKFVNGALGSVVKDLETAKGE